MTAAARGRANRNRGARAEVAVVNWLRRNGWSDARRYLAGDGRQPGDIDVWPGIVVEVKDCARSSWPSWCAQAVTEAGPQRIPVVVRRTRGTPDVARWETRLPLVCWYDLGGDFSAAGWECPTVTDAWMRAWVVVSFGELTELVRADTLGEAS